MRQTRTLPTALRIVALLFLLFGICSSINMALRLAVGSLYLDLGVLGIPTYFGLLRFSIVWRNVALVIVWMELATSLLLCLFGIFGSTPTFFHVRFVGIYFADPAPIIQFIVSVPILILDFWRFYVLTDPRVKALFVPSDEMNLVDDTQPRAELTRSRREPRVSWSWPASFHRASDWIQTRLSKPRAVFLLTVMLFALAFVMGQMSTPRGLPPVAKTALFSADVILQDAETGETLNPGLSFPSGAFSSMTRVNNGPWKVVVSDTIGSISANLDGIAGRVRLVWIGLPGHKYAFRLYAEGYAPVEIPEEYIVELHGSRASVGFPEPAILKIRKSSRALGQ